MLPVHHVAQEEGLLVLTELLYPNVGQQLLLQQLTGVLNTLRARHTNLSTATQDKHEHA